MNGKSSMKANKAYIKKADSMKVRAKKIKSGKNLRLAKDVGN
jgi:hypothetical protein